jgi:hypothetical protein
MQQEDRRPESGQEVGGGLREQVPHDEEHQEAIE